MKNIYIVAACALGMLVLSACSETIPRLFDPKKYDLFDDDQKLTREDYRRLGDPTEAMIKKGEAAKGAYAQPPIPEISPVLAAPRPPKIAETQLVSIAVTDDVPLKDVLIELARLADIDIELDAGISGGVSFRAKEKPFNEVIERIADLAGLRYSVRNGVLRVERDTPYIKNYALDFLNVERASDSSTNISTNVLSTNVSSSGGGSATTGGGTTTGGATGSSTGLNTGSSSSIRSTSEGDFWKALERGITEILNYVPPSRVSQPTADGEIASFTAPPPDVPAVAATGEAAAPPAAATADIAMAEGKPFFIINKQAGILTVSATDRQQALIETYLNRVRASSSAQVLIEAKIVEVDLNEKYQSGIQWSALHSNVNPISAVFGGVTDPELAGNLFTFNTTDSLGLKLDLNAVVRLAEIFGTTRTLSSPRLHAINNQQAVLTFAENQVYFEIEVDRETNNTSGTQQQILNVDSTIKTVPIGIILTMQPSINLDTDEITLNIRPTLSRVLRFVSDPAVAFLIAQINSDDDGDTPVADIENAIPVVEVRELDSILKLKSGQVMVMGGLMEQGTSLTDRGVPGVSEVPWIGRLFKGADESRQNSELIIFIRATIVGSNGYVPPADETIYKKFSDDPRPIAF